MIDNRHERIICAAIWYKAQPTQHYLPENIDKGVVVCGLRLPDCIYIFNGLTGKRQAEAGEYVEGFITNKHRFVDRYEALTIALAAYQIIDEDEIRGKELYSEDLY